MNEFLDEFADIFLKLKNKDQIKQFLQEILTQNELEDLRLRIELLKMLQAGLPQRSIARDLKVSLCKITRGSKILKKENNIIKDILN